MRGTVIDHEDEGQKNVVWTRDCPTWNGLESTLPERNWNRLRNILARMDWRMLYLEWTGVCSTWNGLGSALPGMDWGLLYLEWIGVCCTWNETHHGESDEEHRGKTLVCQRVQYRAQHGGLPRKPPSYVAVYLQNEILRNTHCNTTHVPRTCFTYTVYQQFILKFHRPL